MSDLPAILQMSEDVASALKRGLPVVALESTVLTHGLPHPENFSILNELEEIIREEDVIPATVIVLDGTAHIGLDGEIKRELELRLRQPENFLKLARRDLALAFARSDSGGTTVSATLKLAGMCGIEIFSTGGIGGVHRDWESTFDISSDLRALAEIPIAVVSAGCKAILDIPATLEYLETLAIPVLGWKTDSFPQFYTQESEHPIGKIDSAAGFASFWKHHIELDGRGVLIANPIPEKFSIPLQVVETGIQAAIEAARQHSIKGKALTPFLLDYLARQAKGGFIEANLALLKNNALLGAKLAMELKKKG
jgi:pseudouridylate synthase